MKKSWIAGILGVLVLCVSMVACIEDDEKSAVKAAYGGSSQSSAMAHSATASASSAVSSVSSNNEVRYESDNGEIAFDYDAGSNWDTPMPDNGAMREEVASRGYNQKGSSEADQHVDLKSEMLVYRCSIWMDTMEFEKTVAALKRKISEFHGFVENEQQSDGTSETSRYRLDEKEKNYSYFATIRIPSAYYESFVSATEGLGILRSKNSSVDNVATQYGTLKNQLQIAQTEYDRYLQQYENTQDEKVALKIQSELYNLAVTISDLKTRMSMMENDVAYSYVTIRIHKVTEKELEPKEEEKKEEPEEDTFATRMSKTADESWKQLLGFLESVLVFLIMNWWIIVLVAILLIIVIFLIRFLTRRAARIRAKKRAEEQAQIEERRKQREAEEDHFGNHYQAARMQGSRGAAASAKESRNVKEKPEQKKEESSDSENEETEKK